VTSRFTGFPGGQPELVDNYRRYEHAEALHWLAERYQRSLSVATGYVRLPGLNVLATLPGREDRSVRLLIGAVPEPGLGEDSLTDEVLEAGRLFDEALRRLRAERDFDAFPPSRRLQALQKVDEFLAQERVEVRHYQQRFLHGKAYIFADPMREQPRDIEALLVTSANLTRGGMFANRELGLVHYQPGVVDQGLAWFEELWEESRDFKQELRDLLFPEVPEYSPQTIFLRMLLEYYGDELPPEVSPSEVGTLARFQRDGFERAMAIAQDHGGVIYADGVGTGKTFVGLEFLREFSGKRGLYSLVVAPAQLRDSTWQPELLRKNLPGQVVSYQELASDRQLMPGGKKVLALDKDVYRLIIIDEAHAFRTPDTTYYKALDRLLGGTPKTLVLLTATPVNNALWDLYHQIMLFARHDAAFANSLGIRDLRAFFRDAGANNPDLISPSRLFPLIDGVAVRRDRRFLEEHYADDIFPDGTRVKFPKPRLLEKRYDLDSVYPGVFQEIVDCLDPDHGMKMARYTPHKYLRSGAKSSGAEEAMAGLIRSGLLKRFESSVYAAHETIHRMLSIHDALIEAIETQAAVPSLSALRSLIRDVADLGVPSEAIERALEDDDAALLAEDFNDAFLDDVKSDREALAKIADRLERLMELPDPKLAALKELLTSSPSKKIAVFTGYADTGRYLVKSLLDDEAGRGGRSMVAVIGDELDSDARERRIEQFAPKSVTGDPTHVPADGECDLLIATDVISEGQNLQEAQAVISYDMPWNPQRVVQRNGRVIRLKSQHDEVYLHTLLPEKGDLDRLLKLEAKLRQKINAANASVGMESQVLAAVEAESRAYAELKSFTDRLAEGDETLIDEGEGRDSGSFVGEEYRARLTRAKAEGEIEHLKTMPWGVGSCFVPKGSSAAALPAVVFAAKDGEGRRHWRAVFSNGEVMRTDLDMLRLADPAQETRAEMPDDLNLDALWTIAVDDICREHNALLDPAATEQRLPLSQRWALDLLRDPSIPDRPEFAAADAALLVARDQAVQLALSSIRREHDEEKLTALQAAGRVAEVVREFGLQPAQPPPPPSKPLKAEDLGVVVYQVVRAPVRAATS
jgi:superfamily II DNA or RNA helicase